MPQNRATMQTETMVNKNARRNTRNWSSRYSSDLTPEDESDESISRRGSWLEQFSTVSDATKIPPIGVT